MSTPTYIKTGKENALYSLYQGVMNQFSGWAGNLSSTSFMVYPMSFNQNMTFPCLTIQDVGGPSLGAKAMGRQLQEGFSGYEEQTQVEFNIYDQDIDGSAGSSAYSFAEQNVRRIRDVLKDYLENAAYPGSTGAQIYPPIKLLDGNNGNADTQSQVWFENETPGTWTETFITNTSEQPTVKRYRIYSRIHWNRYTVTPSGNN